VSDVFTRYELALEQLLARLGKQHPRAAEARTLEARLRENIAAARRYGDTDTRQAQRAQIREALDLLAVEALNVTFNELLYSPERAAEAGEAPVAMAERVFLAYSHQDEAFAHRLAANLRDQGVALWVDRWDIQPGTDWDQAIDDAAYDCGRFLIVLSPTAVRSPDVRGELRIAIAERKPIIPVLYRACRIPRQLQLVQYVDFTACGPDDGPALRAVLGALGVGAGHELATNTRMPGPDAQMEPTAAPVSPPPVQEPRQPFEPEMVRIPAGEFLMGSDPQKDKDAQNNEQPQQRLHLPEYSITRTPVTNAQYAAFVRAENHRVPNHWKKGAPPQSQYNHPVVNISWHDAMSYCRWLAEKTGRPYTLPTEAQWEKAARGADGRIYPWGNTFDSARCNTKESGVGRTTPVGRYSPAGDSPYGCADMAGNVWEWCLTKWRDSYRQPEDNDPAGSESRVLRGGAFDFFSRLVRCAYRRSGSPNLHWEDYGFRVVVAAGDA